MTTTTATLTDFLLARIADDEAAAREACLVIGDFLTARSAARVQAQCEATRRIAAEHPEATWIRRLGDDSTEEGLGRCATCADWPAVDFEGPPGVPWPCPTLRALAAVYSDHDDYREEWGA